MPFQGREFENAVERARGLLMGPLGSRGMRQKDVAKRLMDEGMSPQDAFLVTKAGVQLAEGMGHKTRKADPSKVADNFLSGPEPGDMEIPAPQTLDDWQSYVKTLAGNALWSKVIAANSQDFVVLMMNDGYTMEEIKEILLYMVRQMVFTGMRIPDAGAFDLRHMAMVDPRSKGRVLTDLEINEIETRPEVYLTEDIDLG